MMKAPSVFLRSEITSQDILLLRHWMNDHEVCKYLNEENHISSVLSDLLSRENIPVYTPLFNQNGRFFMICTHPDDAVGFVRMVSRTNETEIVLAIGDRVRWGRGLGTSAIHASLSKAFFNWRVGKVVAYIHPQNIRSERAFLHSGFTERQRKASARRFELTMDEFIRGLRS